jgi:hypothetical protein
VSSVGGVANIISGGVVVDLSVDNYRTYAGASPGAGFYVCYVSGTGSVTNLFLENISTHSGGGFFVRSEATGVLTNIYLNNVDTKNTNNPLYLRAVANIYANNWKHAGSSVADMSGALTWKFYGGCDSAATHFVLAGGALVEAYGYGWRGDPLVVAAATNGQFMTSTQAGADGGPCVKTSIGWIALGTAAAGANTIIT